MAFTDLEKDCIRQYHRYLCRKRGLGETEATDLEIILTGDETAKRAVVKTWIESHAKPGVDTTLTEIDSRKTALQTEQTNFQAWLDANP